MSWVDGLDEQFFADRPTDPAAWIVEHVPEQAHFQRWAGLLDLVKTTAIGSLANRSGDPEAKDFRLAVSMLGAALDLGRVPPSSGMSRLYVYATEQERWGPPSGPRVAELEPDALVQRILAVVPPSVLAGQEPDSETDRLISSISLTLRWAAGRATDPDLVRKARIVLGEEH